MRSFLYLAVIATLGVGCAAHHAGASDAGGVGGSGALSDAGDCGAQVVPIAVMNLGDPPDLLVVLDRSGSMRFPLASLPLDPTPRWTIMTKALDQLTLATQSNVRYGLLEFPTDSGCAVDQATAVPVGVGLGNAGAIANRLTASPPQNGKTPAATALRAARAYYASIPVNPVGRYVLFATDGDPNCTASPQADTVAAVSALAADGIKTFVLGFGTSQFQSTATLESSAVAGGVPRPGGPPDFYDANNATDLQTALDQIAGGIIVPSCTFQLASPPPDPNNVTVEIGGVPVPRSPSHGDGWDYYPDAMTITFFGSACAEITSGGAPNVSFLYGCPGQVIQ